MPIYCRDLIESETNHPKLFIKKSSAQDKPANEVPMRNRSDEVNTNHINCPKPTIYFKDGCRSVDFVLVWDSFEKEAVTDGSYQRRKIFETNLIKEGLELEYELPENNGLNFIKVNFYHYNCNFFIVLFFFLGRFMLLRKYLDATVKF